MASLVAFCIRRPVFTSMMALLVVLLGGLALERTPVDLLPDIESPRITVRVSYPEASPGDVEESVTRPLEEALSAINGVEEVRSVSSEGESRVTLSFIWGTDLGMAAMDVREKIDRILSRFPDEVKRPVIRKFDSAAMPVATLAFSSSMPLLEAREYVEKSMAYRFEQLPGVASVVVAGGFDREVHVDFSLERIEALELSLSQVAAKLREENINVPGGSVLEGSRKVRLRIPGSFTTLETIREVVLFYRRGAPVLLGDVAEITSGTGDKEELNRVDGREAVQLYIYKQSGENTVAVADAVAREMKRINRNSPQGKLVLLFDSSEYIRQSLGNVAASALGGGLLALGVLFFFLNSLPATFVIATAIPLSLTACFGLMYFAGFSLNIMSLGGLALGMGMLVDNAIVVLENIARHQEGQPLLSPSVAALEGTREMGLPLLGGTLTTAVVFLPLLFVGGMGGVLFRQLALVVAFSLFCSLGVALTVVPMLSARCVHPGEFHAKYGVLKRIQSFSNGFFERLQRGYAGVLAAALRHPFGTAGIVAALLGGALFLAPLVGTELMPRTDESEVRLYFSAAPGTSLEVMESTVRTMENILRKTLPELRVLQVRTGGRYPPHKGSFRIKLLPGAERSRSSREIVALLGKIFRSLPGMVVRPRVSSSMMERLLGGRGERTVDVDIRGYDTATAEKLAETLAAKAGEIPGITDAEIDKEDRVPEYTVEIDREKAAYLGLSVKDIAESLRILVAGETAGTWDHEGEPRDIVIQGEKGKDYVEEELLGFALRNSRGISVPLRNVAHLKRSRGAVAIQRKDRERVLTVKFSAPRRPQGEIVEGVRRVISRMVIPPGFEFHFSGEYEKQRESFRELLFSLFLALVLVYMVMACQFESLKDPFLVMISVPLAALGVVPVLFLTGTTLNLQSFMGCILLAGIVVNNAILLVDQANRFVREEGMLPRRAAELAGIRRLRPILMTALTTCLGLLPLAFAFGDGGEAQAPLARAVIGGMTSSTLITLILIPVLYSLGEGRFPRKV